MKDVVLKAKRASSAIALIHKEQKKFTYDELVFGLRMFKCPYPVAIISILIKLKLIKKELDTYKFIKSHPVYHGCLKSGLIERSAANSQYNFNYKQSINSKKQK